MSGLSITGAPSALAGDVTGPSNANTVVQLTGSAGVVAMLAASLLFGASIVGPNIKQTAASSDVAPQNLTLQAQGPFAGAAANKIAGDVEVNTPQSVAGGAKYGGFNVKYNGTTVATLGSYNSTTQGTLWLGQTTPNSTNYALESDGSNLTVNSPAAGGTTSFALGVGVVASMTATLFSTAIPLAFTARTSAAATGDIRGPKDFSIKARNSANSADILVISLDGANNMNVGDGSQLGTMTLNAATQWIVGTGATWAIEGTGNGFLDAATVTMRDTTHANVLAFSLANGGASAITWDASVTPTLTQSQATGASSADYTIKAQAAKAGSGSTGGNLLLSAGAPDGSAPQSQVKLQSNGISYLSIGNSGFNCANSSVAIASGTNTLTAAQYATPIVRLTGTISAGVATVVFPNQPGYWIVDGSALAGAGGVAFKSGTTTSATFTTPLTTTAQLIHVSTYGANTISVSV